MAKSMGMNLASGLQGMLKEGHSSYEGVDEAILKNINAAKELAAIVRTSLGPNGENVIAAFATSARARSRTLALWGMPVTAVVILCALVCTIYTTV